MKIFNKNDKVVFLGSVFHNTVSLTIGKTYCVTHTIPDNIYIIDDKNVDCGYGVISYSFCSLREYRKQKIQKLYD